MPKPKTMLEPRPDVVGPYLTPDERETVILMSDANGTAEIYSHQRTILTKLRKNPAAKLLEEGKHSGCAFARYELPAQFLSFRTVKPKRTLTDEQKAAASAHLPRVRAKRSRTAA